MQISLKQLKDELDHAKNPLFLFDDDCDGLCSFLLFYRYVNEGKWHVVKGRPWVDMRYIHKVKEHEPDKIFVLDVPDIQQEFVDEARKLGATVVWVDHHPPLERQHVRHYNPRHRGKIAPTSQLCWEAVQQDDWIAAVGIVSDWVYNDFIRDFSKRYPDLIPLGVSKPEQALYGSEIGRLARIISFNMKGKVSEVMKSVKYLLKASDPKELLNGTGEHGIFLMKRFDAINKAYQRLLGQAMRQGKAGEILEYIYHDDQWSLTKDLSNELVYRYPDKVIIIGRERDGGAKMSIRAKNYTLQPLVEKALVGVDGYGGGHEHACGANVKTHDLKRFLQQFREEIARAKRSG